MKYKGILTQPAVHGAVLVECEIEVEDGTPEKEIKIRLAHKLVQTFEIEIIKMEET